MSTLYVNDLNLSISIKDLSNILGITVQAFHKYVKENNINTKNTNGKGHKLFPQVVRKIIEKRGCFYPHKIINVHNIKGGVGKTTTVHALSIRAAALGAKVLMIDLDMQANLTRSLGVDTARKSHQTMYDLVKCFIESSNNKVDDSIIKLNECLHLIPSSLQLSQLDLFLIMSSAKISLPNLFQSIFENILQKYDFIFIDSPPALSQLTSSAHMFSDLILMPIEMDLFSIDGISYNIEHIDLLKRNHKKNIDISIFVNKYDGRPKADMEILQQLKDSDYGKRLCESYISFTSGLRTNISEGKTVWDSARKHPALSGFENLLFEVTKMNFNVAEIKHQQSRIQSEPASLGATL